MLFNLFLCHPSSPSPSFSSPSFSPATILFLLSKCVAHPWSSGNACLSPDSEIDRSILSGLGPAQPSPCVSPSCPPPPPCTSHAHHPTTIPSLPNCNPSLSLVLSFTHFFLFSLSLFLYFCLEPFLLPQGVCLCVLCVFCVCVCVGVGVCLCWVCLSMCVCVCVCV